jgi:hypothetical protein
MLIEIWLLLTVKTNASLNGHNNEECDALLNEKCLHVGKSIVYAARGKWGGRVGRKPLPPTCSTLRWEPYSAKAETRSGSIPLFSTYPRRTRKKLNNKSYQQTMVFATIPLWKLPSEMPTNSREIPGRDTAHSPAAQQPSSPAAYNTQHTAQLCRRIGCLAVCERVGRGRHCSELLLPSIFFL